MAPRTAFEGNLKDMKEKLLTMSGLVEQMLTEAFDSLNRGDLELAEKVLLKDREINQLDDEINNEAIHLFATQQPVAKDLRKLLTAIKISTELERMGDYSVDIAKIAIRLNGERLIKPLIDLKKMMDISIGMVKDGIEAYLYEDVEKARNMAERDNEVDRLFGTIVPELHLLVGENKAYVDQTTSLAFVARYIERIADHATNIGEMVVYLVTAHKPDLN
ncbi:Phosphate transport system regulatory protein PhoU [[Clostridium] ultunense Esp]|uniref:phosphate signaling complex protein PhoU n=1 Tax=Thermicanus aegyptius TaxID=94009 RepID=UPI0002B6F321|nr:phosphate signaling complex protein PhoU [Thermicanus aegyptius]CCQ94934.1 Phosphate transport system regulatory protein PhoU [[Clostridium] ultunense Esp]